MRMLYTNRLITIRLVLFKQYALGYYYHTGIFFFCQACRDSEPSFQTVFWLTWCHPELYLISAFCSSASSHSHLWGCWSPFDLRAEQISFSHLTKECAFSVNQICLLWQVLYAFKFGCYSHRLLSCNVLLTVVAVAKDMILSAIPLSSGAFLRVKATSRLLCDVIVKDGNYASDSLL